MRWGTPEKDRGIRISSYICQFTMHITVRTQATLKGHYGNTTGCNREAGACAHSVYQVLSPLQFKGPGYEAKMSIGPSFVKEGRRVKGERL